MSLSDVQKCRENGWTVGTKLIGDEGHGPAIIKITAIGESHILARAVMRRGHGVSEPEGLWTLECRDWQQVP